MALPILHVGSEECQERMAKIALKIENQPKNNEEMKGVRC